MFLVWQHWMLLFCNFRCVEHKHCQNPIAPDASGEEGKDLAPDIRLDDGMCTVRNLKCTKANVKSTAIT